MVNKQIALRYLLLTLIVVVLVSILVVLRGGFTGMAVFEDSGSGFNNGVFENTSYNGSGVVLNGDNLTGAYTSEVFDAGNDSAWNNVGWDGSEPDVELLYAVDGSGAVYSSSDFGVTWDLKTGDYGRGSATQGMFSDTTYLYIIAGGAREIWRSLDGATWAVINDSFNRDLEEGEVDLNNKIYVIGADGTIWQSTDFGVSWNVKGDFNADATNDAKGSCMDSNNNFYITDGSKGVFLSSDDGVNWIEKIDNYGGGAADDIACLGTDLYIIKDKQVWKSSDSGVSWNEINGDAFDNKGLRADVFNNLFYVIDTKGKFYNSSDGITWNLIGDMNPGDNDPKGLTNFIQGTNLSFQVRNCSLSDCSDGNWEVVNLNSVNLLGRYFQYKVSFKSFDNSVSPSLENVSIDYDVLNSAPNVIIEHPENSSYNFGVDIGLNYSASDSEGNIDSCWYGLNGGTTVILSSCENTTLSLDFDGSYFVDVFVNDSFGLEFSDRVSFNLVNTAPLLSFDSPQTGATYGYNESLNLNFVFSDNEDNIGNCWYNLDNGINISLVGCQNVTFDIATNGDYTLNLFANDSLGLETDSSVSFSVLIGAPTVVLNYPISVYLSGNLTEFNYTPTDIDLESCELWGDFDGDFKLNQTDNSVLSGQINSFSLGLGEGTYLWNIWCNDTIGNGAFNGNKTFYVDRTVPDLSISEPVGGKVSREGIQLAFSVSDDSPVSCLYNVGWSTGGIVVENTSIECFSTSFNVATDGNYVLNFFASDSAGNVNRSNSSFSVTTSTGGGSSSGGSSGGGVVILREKNKTELGVTKLGEILVRAGDKKTLSLNAHNTGTLFLNNCRIIIEGDFSSWFYSSQIGGIAPGQNIDFVFDLNIPEGVELGEYFGKIIVDCNEIIDEQEITVKIPHGLQLIEIKEIVSEKNNLNISYKFDNSDFIGETVSVEIWVFDEEEVEVSRYIDTFPINKDGLIERNILVELPAGLVGIYGVYFALSSNLDDFEKQTVVLGKSSATGFMVLGDDSGKNIGYFIFLLIVGLVVFFIYRRSKKESLKKE